jgi:hypothetical protein
VTGGYTIDERYVNGQSNDIQYTAQGSVGTGLEVRLARKVCKRAPW